MRSLHFISQFRQTLNPRRNPNFILTFPIFTRQFTSAPQQLTPPSDNVSAIVDDISKLTLLEVSDLMVVLRDKLEIKELPLMAPMVPGMRFNLGADGNVGGAAAAARGAAAMAKAEEKAEKTAFDVKLEAFDAASKIKVIKEVRGITALGLKEAKDLVEKAPTLLKKGVTKEEAEKIMEKMKEIGAKVTME